MWLVDLDAALVADDQPMHAALACVTHVDAPAEDRARQAADVAIVQPLSTIESSIRLPLIRQPSAIETFGPSEASSTTLPSPITTGPRTCERSTLAPAPTTTLPVDRRGGVHLSRDRRPLRSRA